ncbi:MAG: TetR/AcrR family transcriptional regulator, partial [Eubacteriales bacterium]
MAEQKNKIRSEKTQSAILQAATFLAKRNGWKNTRIQEVCALAGVSVGAFYHHFASKQELMNRAFLIFDDSLSDRLISAG